MACSCRTRASGPMVKRLRRLWLSEQHRSCHGPRSFPFWWWLPLVVTSSWSRPCDPSPQCQATDGSRSWSR
ncbi:unnamed protein product, partial [Durusdinium trenchii]